MTKTIYMLYDEYGSFVGGPYTGAAGLDFPSLAAAFRTERYAEAEASREDYCSIYILDFVGWLLNLGILAPVDTIPVTIIEIDTRGQNRYVPKHWPTCPQCGAGRGEESMGRVLHSLNRAEWYRECTGCGHAWDHHHEPCDHRKPMLEDDGRYIPNGCVPYAISQASGISIHDVLDVCARHGWGSDGMHTEHALAAAAELGLRLIPGPVGLLGPKPTLRRLLGALPTATSYIAETRDHWLAIVNGVNRDPADKSRRTEVIRYWEVQRGGRRDHSPCCVAGDAS